MSYRDILGHASIKDMFKRVLSQGRLSSSYLFYGAQGIGKLAFALEFAKAVQCAEQKGEPCDICPSCQKAHHQNHPDISLYGPPEGKVAIPIDTIRQIQKDTSFIPLEGTYRIAIIEQAHRLTTEGANAFLKTLEEPEGNALFILVTHNISALLPTILSRCQKIPFPPIPLSEIEAHLVTTGISSEMAVLCARASMGSLERAREMAQGKGVECRDGLLDLFRDLPTLEMAEVSKKIFQLLELLQGENKRKTLISLLEMAMVLLRDGLLVHHGSPLPLVNVDGHQLPEIFSSYSQDQLVEMMETLRDFKRRAEKFHLELLVDSLSIELKENF